MHKLVLLFAAVVHDDAPHLCLLLHLQTTDTHSERSYRERCLVMNLTTLSGPLHQETPRTSSKWSFREDSIDEEGDHRIGTGSASGNAAGLASDGGGEKELMTGFLHKQVREPIFHGVNTTSCAPMG